MIWKDRRIVIVGPAPPYRGGIAQFVDGLAKHLHAHHKISILSFRRQYPAWLFPGTQQKDESNLSVSVPCFERLDSINPVSWYKCGQWLAAQQPDLVLLNHWMPFFGPAFGRMLRTLRKRSHARIIFICHNIVPHEPSRLDNGLTRYALQTGDAFIVMSEEVKRDLRRFRPEAPCQLSPLPLNETFPPPPARGRARAELALPAKARVLLFFGLVRAYKGLDVLLEALAILRDRHPVHLVVAGEFYQPQRPYMEQIRANRLESLVQVHAAFVPIARVGVFFSAADAVVLPYRTATQSGIAKMAYYFDRPVIVTDAGGLPNELENEVTGVLARAGDAASLAGAIQRFFELRQKVSFVDNVRAFKQRYSWSHFLSAIRALDS